MGYILHAFIGRQNDLYPIASNFQNAKLIEVSKEIFIIPMTESLYDEINDDIVSEEVGALTYMSKNVEELILKIVGNSRIGYLEAEYHGGRGGQSAILWENSKRYRLFDFDKGVINTLLNHFGIIAQAGLDEFDTLNFGRHRNTEDWLT